MENTELELLKDRSDSKNISHPLYFKVVDRVSSYLDYYDGRLNNESFDFDENVYSLRDFFKHLNPLSAPLSKELLEEELNNLITERVRTSTEARLLAQKNTLKNNKAFLRHGENYQLEWYYFPNGLAPSEEHVIALDNISVDYITNIDWLNEANNNGFNIFDYIECKIVQKVENILKAMESNAPWTGAVNSKSHNNLEKQVEAFVNGLRNLAEICNKLNTNLPEYIFSYIKDDSKINAIFKKVAVELVDEQLADINDAFLPPRISRKEKKAQKLANYTLDKVIDRNDNRETDKPLKENNIHEYILENEPKELDLGEFDFNFSWMQEGVLSRAKLYKGSKQDVVLVKAMSPKHEKISQIARDGLKKNLEGEDKIDITIKQVIKRIGDGIMPYEDSNSIKGLKTEQKDMRPEYSEEKIWYTFDISSNSPRIYFTIKAAPESVMGELNNKTIMLVVLAESDKARQIDSLKRLTKLSRPTLAARGAGSI